MTLLSALLGDPETEALLSDQAELDAILRFEVALAGAEADAGLISEAAAEAVRIGIENFTPDWTALAQGMATDGLVVPALLKQLRPVLAEDHRDALHKGATSQDAIDTALILRLAEIFPIFQTRLQTLRERFDALAEQFGDAKLMAHTRMQQALPFTVSDKLATWSEPLERQLGTLRAMRRRLLVIQLGGPIGNRGTFEGKGEDLARRLAQRLDLGLAPSWHAQRDPLAEFGALLSTISGTLGKFGADVALMAQNEVAEIKLTGGGGSSAMAHKSNPVNAEVLVALARFNAGLLGTLHQALVHENERSGAAWTLEWLVLPPMLVTTGASLRLALKLAEQISFPPQA